MVSNGHFVPPDMPHDAKALPTLWERHHRLEVWHADTASKVSSHATVLAKVEGAITVAKISGAVVATLVSVLIALAGLTFKRVGDVHSRIESITQTSTQQH